MPKKNKKQKLLTFVVFSTVKAFLTIGTTWQWRSAQMKTHTPRTTNAMCTQTKALVLLITTGISESHVTVSLHLLLCFLFRNKECCQHSLSQSLEICIVLQLIMVYCNCESMALMRNKTACFLCISKTTAVCRESGPVVGFILRKSNPVR